MCSVCSVCSILSMVGGVLVALVDVALVDVAMVDAGGDPYVFVSRVYGHPRHQTGSFTVLLFTGSGSQIF